MSKPKILCLDIETSPLTSYTWGTYDQSVAPNQIKEDWFIMSWAAKFLDKKTIYQEDQRKAKNIRNDKAILKSLWELMDEADIILGQNSQNFDVKKINARFIQQGFNPPSPYQQIDTLKLARKLFGFTYNKLEYTSSILVPEQKKSEHSKFPGMKLWTECLNGNQTAWREMAKYNIQDVLATEALYKRLAPWGVNINFTSFDDGADLVCQCGSKSFHKNGTAILKGGRVQKYRCNKCGAIHTSKIKKKSA